MDPTSPKAVYIQSVSHEHNGTVHGRQLVSIPDEHEVLSPLDYFIIESYKLEASPVFRFSHAGLLVITSMIVLPGHGTNIIFDSKQCLLSKLAIIVRYQATLTSALMY